MQCTLARSFCQYREPATIYKADKIVALPENCVGKSRGERAENYERGPSGRGQRREHTPRAEMENVRPREIWKRRNRKVRVCVYIPRALWPEGGCVTSFYVNSLGKECHGSFSLSIDLHARPSSVYFISLPPISFLVEMFSLSLWRALHLMKFAAKFRGWTNLLNRFYTMAICGP